MNESSQSYDLFECPHCEARFLREELLGAYPRLACPFCGEVADTAWQVFEESDERAIRLARLWLTRSYRDAKKAKAIHDDAVEHYAKVAKTVTGNAWSPKRIGRMKNQMPGPADLPE